MAEATAAGTVVPVGVTKVTVTQAPASTSRCDVRAGSAHKLHADPGQRAAFQTRGRMSGSSSVASGWSKMSGNASGMLAGPTDREMRSRMAKLQALQQTDKEMIACLQSKVEEQRIELNERDKTVAAIQRNFENLTLMCQDDRSRVCQLQEQLDEAKAEILRLSDEAASSEILSKTVEKMKHQAEEQDNVIHDLRLQLSKVEDRARQADRMQHREAQARRKALIEIEQLKMDAEARNAAHREAVKRMQVRIDQHPALEKVDDLQQQLELLQSEHQALMQTYAATRKRAATIHEENTQLRDKWATSEADKVMLQQEVERMRDSSSQAEQQAASNRTQAARISELQQRLRDLSTQNEALQGSMQRGMKERRQLEAALVEKRDELATVNADRSKLRQALQQAGADHQAALFDKSAQHRRSVRLLTEEVERLNAEACSKDEDLLKLERVRQEQVHRLTESLASVRASAESEQASVRQEAERGQAKAARQVQETRRALTELQKELAEVNDMLSAAHESHAITKERLRVAETQLYDPRMKRLAAREKQLSKTVAKLESSTAAIEATVTCLACMRVLRNPVTLMPCRHTYCNECLDATKQRGGGSVYCRECGPMHTVDGSYANDALEHVCSKYGYQRQQVDELLHLCRSTINDEDVQDGDADDGEADGGAAEEDKDEA